MLSNNKKRNRNIAKLLAILAGAPLVPALTSSTTFAERKDYGVPAVELPTNSRTADIRGVDLIEAIVAKGPKTGAAEAGANGEYGTIMDQLGFDTITSDRLDNFKRGRAIFTNWAQMNDVKSDAQSINYAIVSDGNKKVSDYLKVWQTSFPALNVDPNAIEGNDYKPTSGVVCMPVQKGNKWGVATKNLEPWMLFNLDDPNIVDKSVKDLLIKDGQSRKVNDKDVFLLKTPLTDLAKKAQTYVGSRFLETSTSNTKWIKRWYLGEPATANWNSCTNWWTLVMNKDPDQIDSEEENDSSNAWKKLLENVTVIEDAYGNPVSSDGSLWPWSSPNMKETDKNMWKKLKPVIDLVTIIGNIKSSQNKYAQSIDDAKPIAGTALAALGVNKDVTAIDCANLLANVLSGRDEDVPHIANLPTDVNELSRFVSNAETFRNMSAVVWNKANDQLNVDGAALRLRVANLQNQVKQLQDAQPQIKQDALNELFGKDASNNQLTKAQYEEKLRNEGKQGMFSAEDKDNAVKAQEDADKAKFLPLGVKQWIAPGGTGVALGLLGGALLGKYALGAKGPQQNAIKQGLTKDQGKKPGPAVAKK